MTYWIEMALSNAVLATGLALVAAGVSRWGRCPTLAHALWVLVLVKLVTPAVVSVPVLRTTATAEEATTASSHDRQLGSTHAATKSATRVATPDEPVDETRRSDRRLAGVTAAGPTGPNTGDDGKSTDRRTTRTATVPPVTAPATEPKAPRSAGQPRLSALFVTRALIGLWIAGAVFYFVRVASRLVRFRRLMRLARDPQPPLQRFVEQLAHRIGLSRSPRVALVPGTVSPMVFAAGRQSLLIVPQDLVGYLADERQLETLIAHELAHLRRGDHWVRRLELVVAGLYWWLPTVWLTRRGLREVEEEICDAWVVKTLPAANRSYAEALLNTVDFLSGAKPFVPPVSSTMGHFRFIKRRIVMIMRGSVATRLAWTGRLSVLLLAVAFLPISLGSARPAAVDETDEPTTVRSADDPPEFSFIEQRRDDQDEDQDESRERRRRRQRDDRDDRDEDEDEDEDEERDVDVEDIRQEVLEELKSELAELNDEIAEAMEEVREELTDELRSAPPYIQRIISQIDIDELLDDVLEDAPGPVRTFVDEVNIQAIVKEALRDADIDDIDYDYDQAEELQKMIMKEVSRELKSAIGQLNGELRRAQAEVRRAMRTAPPEVRQMLEEIDIEDLLEELLEGSLPVVREMVGELEIEDIVEEALEGREDRDEDEAVRERGDDEGEDEGVGRARGRGEEEDREAIEAKLESRLDQLMREAEDIRRELRRLRRRGSEGGR